MNQMQDISLEGVSKVGNISCFYNFSKRAFDFTASFLGIFLLLPMFIIIAVLIKIEDMGPVFFKQERVGKAGKSFYMYKFRSMIVNADDKLESLSERNEAVGPLFKIKDDPRMTRVGKLLRKTSLDEFPQLINVLKGEMSLVGPRPALPSEVQQYKPIHKERLQVLQGMTGLWQISGRSNLTFDQMIDLDLEYVHRRSLWFDLYLVLMTIPALIGSDDAF